MDEKRFTELFPEPEHGRKKEEEKKREKFFEHIKMQIQPERRWELPEAGKVALLKTKKKKRTVLIYGATAAALLILVIALPNLSSLLKMSGKTEKDHNIVSENSLLSEDHDKLYDDIADNSELGHSTKDSNTDSFSNQGGQTEESDPETDAEKSPDNNNENHQKKKIRKKKEEEEENSEENKQVPKGENEKTQKQKSQDSGEEKEGNLSEKQKDSNGAKQETLSSGSKKPSETIGSIKDTSVPVTDTEDMLPSDSQQDDLEFPPMPESSAENDMETTGNDSTVTGAVSVPPEDAGNLTESDFKEALTGWWEEENGKPDSESKPENVATDANADYGSHGQDHTVEESIKPDMLDEKNETITKENVKRELTAYPYLCYYHENGKESWYQAGKEIQQKVEGKELLGTALIFKKKSPILDQQNKQQNVYIYGDKSDLSTVFVRFRAEGEDWYYEYQK